MNNMQVLLASLIVICQVFTMECLAQDKEPSEPETKYDVHRQYDENGNLIEYDSAVTMTWSSDESFNSDSLFNFWRSDNEDSMYYGDRMHDFNDDPHGFNQIPGMNFPEIDDIIKEFHESFNFPGSDSLHIFNDPAFPFFNPGIDFSLQIREMEKRMEELRQQQGELLKDLHKNYTEPESKEPVPDSLVVPESSPSDNYKSPAIINI